MDKLYWAGCNYYVNTGKCYEEPKGAATAMHDCMACDKLDTCTMKKETITRKLCTNAKSDR